MRISEVLRQLGKVPVRLEHTEINIQRRFMLAQDSSTVEVPTKMVVRRSMADVYRAIFFSPILAAKMQMDDGGAIRIGPFEVLYNGTKSYAYLSFYEAAPLSILFFVEMCISKQRIKQAASV